jgi:AAA+ superfamily predicted ATPase
LASDHLPDSPSLVRDLLAYFVRHHHARATLDDLARWRIEQERASHTLDQVNRAIDWLEQPPNQLLVRWPEGPDQPGPTVFRLNPAKTADAERMLAQLSESPQVFDVARRGAAAPALPATLLLRALAWVDETLRRYNRAHPLTRPADHPGEARDPDALEWILSPVVAPQAAAGDDDTRELIAAVEAADPAEPLTALYRHLQLTPLELQVVLLALAAEIDAKYHLAFGIRNDDLGRRGVTLGLACALLGNALDVRLELERSSALTRWRLLDSGGVFPHAEDTLRLDPFVIAWLFGHAGALAQDPRLTALVRPDPWPGADWLGDTAEAALVERVRERLTSGTERWTAIAGGQKNGARASVEGAARLTGALVLRVVLPSSPSTDAAESEEVIIRIARAARLAHALPVVDAAAADANTLGPGGLARLLDLLASGPRHLVIVASDLERITSALPRTPGDRIDADLPPELSLATVFEAAAAKQQLEVPRADAERIAASFRLSLDAIETAVRLAAMRVKGTTRSPEGDAAALFEACRRVASPDLPRFGRRVEPVFTLDDVVLPKAHRAQMDEIVAHVRHAPHVMHRWEFSKRLPYGRGVAALFSGPPGTGKTMAAQAIARELGTEAYVVDLSRVVSKYIGETEKNIDVVFEDAERSGVVLCFDEADALFSKRSEIKDAHDRYANIEVAYLLQRIEAFGARGGLGLAILTSNFKQNLDPALVRRLRFIVEFAKPDQTAREEIWSRSLKGKVDLAQNVNLRFLAKRLDISGGHIQQIAIRAAFAAASEGAHEIDMRHLMGAARAEVVKLGLAATERELAAFEATFRRNAEASALHGNAEVA